IVAAQQAAVSEGVASSRPQGVPAWRPPAPQDVADLAGSVRGGEAVTAWLAGTLLPVADVLASLLDLPDAVAGIASALGGAGARALMGSRTAVHDAGRSATLATYRAQPPGTITGWRWVATLDDATCLGCVSLHGTVFSLADGFQEAHHGCRCESVPEVTGQSDINDTGDDWLAEQIAAGDLRNIPPTARDDVVNGRLELRDFLLREPDQGFGSSYREAPLWMARARAAREGRSTGPSTLPYPRTGRSTTIPPDPRRTP
ncbi:phage minor head protein, partial [Iamia sp.]|uniref:phage minor head protein n=1 Tax=Iamia sp. TaxID=2722710 RepID=UPI002C2C24A9